MNCTRSSASSCAPARAREKSEGLRPPPRKSKETLQEKKETRPERKLAEQLPDNVQLAAERAAHRRSVVKMNEN
jgi:hypothetical protein